MPNKVWTAEELEGMTPAERHARFEASVETNLDKVPDDLLERARRRVEERSADNETPSR